MNNQIRSYNSSVASELKSFLPTTPQLLLDLLLGFLLLAFFNIRGLWRWFSTGGIGNGTQVDIGGLIHDRAHWMTDTYNSFTQGRGIQILIWIVIGCCIYLIFWFVSVLITNLRNDIVANEYVHPKTYKSSWFWGSVLQQKGFFLCMVILLVGYIYCSVKLLNYLANLSYHSVINFQLYPDLPILISSLLASAITVHVFFMVFQLTKNSWNYIYKDL